MDEEDETDADGTDGDATDGQRRHRRRQRRHRRRRTTDGTDADADGSRRELATPSPAASSRSTRRSSSPTTGSSSRSPCRAPRKAASTTSSRSRTSSGWSPPGGLRTPGAPPRQGGRDDLGGAGTRPTSPGGRSRSSATVDPDRVANAFADGATIVLQALHHTWLPLARFCRELEAELGAGVQANSYYTPRRSQGFAVHHDTHDVFVLQVAGEKHWRVYDPLLELPLKAQRWSSSARRAGADRARADAPRRRHALSPARLAARRAHLRDRLAPRHRRRQRPHLGGRVPRRARRVRGRRRVPPLGARGRRDARRTCSSGSPSAPDGRGRRAPARGRASSTAAGRSSTATSRRCASSSRSRSTTLLERRPTVIADLDGTTLSFEGKHVELPEHAAAELEAIVAADEPVHGRPSLPASSTRTAGSSSSGG